MFSCYGELLTLCLKKKLKEWKENNARLNKLTL